MLRLFVLFIYFQKVIIILENVYFYFSYINSLFVSIRLSSFIYCHLLAFLSEIIGVVDIGTHLAPLEQNDFFYLVSSHLISVT